MYAICSCEDKICFPFRAHQAAGGVLFPGPDVVALDREACIGCGICIDRCCFNANVLIDGIAEVNPAKCYGCGFWGDVLDCYAAIHNLTIAEAMIDLANRFL